MYLLYADDAGSVPDPNQEHFVWAGVSVFERQAYWISQELDGIAARFNPANPAAVELHGSDMLQGRREFKGLPLASRLLAMTDALRVMAKSHQSNRLFAAVIHKDVIAPEDAAFYGFEQLSSRFDMFLKRLHDDGDTQRGLLVFDKSTYETQFQQLTARYRAQGHRWGIIRNLAEVPLFLDSKASRLIQLADLVAYACFRKFEKQDARFFDIVSGRFDAHGGIQHGLYTLLKSTETG